MDPSTVTNHSPSVELLGSAGPFAEQDVRFVERSGQQQMAALIEAAIADGHNRVIEFPSGAGKTLAYLLPALLSDKPVVIATSTHDLQYQLLERDIPYVLKVLSQRCEVLLLKGRSNYLCPEQLDKQLRHNRVKDSARQTERLLVAQRFRESGRGELRELGAGIDPQLLTALSSSREECAGSACAHYQQCPFYQQLKRASKARLVIINHHLLVTEIFKKYLAKDAVVIVDEAHRLVEIGQTLTAHSLKSYELYRWLDAVLVLQQQQAPEYKMVREYLLQVKKQLSFWRDQLLGEQQPSKLLSDAEQQQLLALLKGSIEKLFPWLQTQQARSKQFLRLRKQADNLLAAIAELGGQEQALHRLRSQGRGFVIENIPVNFACQFQQDDVHCWIFTSATFSVENDSRQSLSLLGMDEQNFVRIPYEQDFQQALLYLPSLSVEPDHADYYPQFVDRLLALHGAVSGRKLVLFSSYWALQKAADLLQLSELVSNGDMLVQGQGANHELIRSFKQKDGLLLLGTGSFWEGFDLGGIPLSAVVIDKLPFASPDDPVLQWRGQYLEQCGGNSFQSLLLPDAVIRLRQGCGRLLRRIEDKGVIMLADPRLRSKAYGSAFLNSLPAINQVDDLAAVKSFFHSS
jgi:ATP-dependent DNA helicase DinG